MGAGKQMAGTGIGSQAEVRTLRCGPWAQLSTLHTEEATGVREKLQGGEERGPGRRAEGHEITSLNCFLILHYA